VRTVFASTPSALRARAGYGSGTAASCVRLRLAVRLPFHAEGVFGHLVATAVPGLEEWRDGAYHRAVRLDHGPAVVSLRPAGDHVAATLRLTDHRDLVSAVARCRWLLDLDADPEAIDAALADDPPLREAVAAAPGRRVPRCVDGGELALRIVLGQQVSTAAARTVTGRLVAGLGEPLPAGLVEDGSSLGWTFPEPAALAAMDPARLPLPRRRAATLQVLAAALAPGRPGPLPRGRPGGGARGARAPARRRPVDRGVGGDARPGPSRRPPGDGPGDRRGRPCARARHDAGAPGPQRALAPVALLRHPGALGPARPPDEPAAGRRGPTHAKEHS